MKLPKELTMVTPASKFLAFILFVTLPFLGFVYGMKYQEFVDFNKQQELSFAAKKVKRLPTPTPDPTANWRTYTFSYNPEFGVSFRYPDTYFQYQADPKLSGVFLATSAPQGGNSPKFFGPNDVWLSAGTLPGVENTSLDQLLTSRPDYVNAQKVPVVIGGISGFKVIYTIMVGPAEPMRPQYVYEGLVEKDNKLYSISMESWNKKVLESNQKLFDQILSTFKFLDSSITGSGF